jgi:hypothetical protein
MTYELPFRRCAVIILATYAMRAVALQYPYGPRPRDGEALVGVDLP